MIQKEHGTMAHEIGHVFGLSENNGNPQSIMCRTSANRAVQVPQVMDRVSIIDKY